MLLLYYCTEILEEDKGTFAFDPTLVVSRVEIKTGVSIFHLFLDNDGTNVQMPSEICSSCTDNYCGGKFITIA